MSETRDMTPRFFDNDILLSRQEIDAMTDAEIVKWARTASAYWDDLRAIEMIGWSSGDGMSMCLEYLPTLVRIIQEHRPYEARALEALGELSVKQQAISQRANVKPSRKKAGTIYILRAGDYYKIGRTTTDPTARLNNLMTQPPFPTEVVHMIKTDDAVELERVLHDRFSTKRGVGEWFAFTSEDVAEIKGLA